MSVLEWEYGDPGADALQLADLVRGPRPATPWLVVTHRGHDSGARVRLERRGDLLVLAARDQRAQLGFLESEHLAEWAEDLPSGEDPGESPRWRLWCQTCEGDEARNVERMLPEVLAAFVRWGTAGGSSTPRLHWS